MITTVESLRSKGYRVYVRHHRVYQDQFVRIDTEKELYEKKSVPTSKGGKTTVEVTTPQGEVLHGQSTCGKSEQFSRKLGVKVALGRALKG